MSAIMISGMRMIAYVLIGPINNHRLNPWNAAAVPIIVTVSPVSIIATIAVWLSVLPVIRRIGTIEARSSAAAAREIIIKQKISIGWNDILAPEAA